MANFMSEDDIDRIFSHHPPETSDVAQLHSDVRSNCRELAHWLNENLPNCPEAILAVRAIQKAMMFSNSAVAQHGLPKKD